MATFLKDVRVSDGTSPLVPLIPLGENLRQSHWQKNCAAAQFVEFPGCIQYILFGYVRIFDVV